MAMPAYMKRYSFRILGFGLAYCGAFIGGVSLMQSSNAPSGIAAYVVATIPALFVIGMIWSIFRMIIECDDEYQRMLFTKAILLATGVTLAMTTLWGFLEAFDLAPHIDLYWVVCIWFPMTGLGGWLVRRNA